MKEYVKKYASDSELLARAEKQKESEVEEKKEGKDNESELSETSLKSDEES